MVNTLNLEVDIFYDYADHQQYHIVGISRNSFDVMNVTEREFANVKKNG